MGGELHRSGLATAAAGLAGNAGRASGRNSNGRNIRSVWTIPTAPFPEAHFATFPPALVDPMVKAGCPKGGVVLDPFAGAFTTALVALSHGRSTIGIEANPTYCDMGRERISKQATLLFANMDFTRNAAAAAGLVLGTGTAPPPFQGATAPNPSEESSL